MTFVIQTTLYFLNRKHLQVLSAEHRLLLEVIYYPLSQMYLKMVVFKLHVPFPFRTYQVIALFSINLILYTKIKISVMIFETLVYMVYLC